MNETHYNWKTNLNIYWQIELSVKCEKRAERKKLIQTKKNLKYLVKRKILSQNSSEIFFQEQSCLSRNFTNIYTHILYCNTKVKNQLKYKTKINVGCKLEQLKFSDWNTRTNSKGKILILKKYTPVTSLQKHAQINNGQ